MKYFHITLREQYQTGLPRPRRGNPVWYHCSLKYGKKGGGLLGVRGKKGEVCNLKSLFKTHQNSAENFDFFKKLR